tara:strand:+ start:4483 stop:4671 length:189 start_codon:yes stop_codon:yes gene_type:complete
MPQRFSVGDLVELRTPVEYSLPDVEIGIVVQVIESEPNQALRVGLCSGVKVWVVAYRLKKIG